MEGGAFLPAGEKGDEGIAEAVGDVGGVSADTGIGGGGGDRVADLSGRARGIARLGGPEGWMPWRARWREGPGIRRSD